jgi:hypothetical protein
MTLCRLIYKSIATAEVVSNETLRDLENKAGENNAVKGITGLLVLTGNVFVQVLEGAAVDVTELFGRISADERHRRLELITYEPAASRLFDEWGMRLVDLYDLPGEKRALMAEKYAGDNGEVSVPSDPHLVYAFLLDAKHVCVSVPWISHDSTSAQDTGKQAS